MKKLLILIFFFLPITIFATLNTQWIEITDEAQWSERRSAATLLDASNRAFIIGGRGTVNEAYNDVWASYSGGYWTQVTGTAEFEGRYEHTALYYDNKYWVIGGRDATTKYNDVWSSTDCVSWTALTKNAFTYPIYAHESIVYDSKMWVIGGIDDNGNTNSVYYSTNGVTWTREHQTEWSARSYVKTTEFDSKIIMTGGYDTTNTFDEVYEYNGSWSSVTKNAEFDARYDHGFGTLDSKLVVYGGLSAPGTASTSTYSSADGILWTLESTLELPTTRGSFMEWDYGEKLAYGGGYKAIFDVRNDVYTTSALSTSTPTITNTHTVSPTNTPVDTATPTATKTNTITITSTPTITETSTGTPTDTPTITVSPTITPSWTHSETRTPTLTWTVSPTPTNTPLNTGTYTITHTITVTYTHSGTPTITITKTNTPVVTVTPTSTVSPIQTPFYEWVETFGNDANSGTSVRLHWRQYNFDNVEYYLNVSDTSRMINETIVLNNDNDIDGVYDDIFVYDLKNLKYFGSYSSYVEVDGDDWTTSYKSKTVDFVPGLTPTVSPTPLTLCFDVNKGTLDSPFVTNSSTFVDTGAEVQVSVSGGQKIVIFCSFSSHSTAGEVTAEYKLIVDGQESYEIERYFSGTNDYGIGGIVTILTPSGEEGVETLQTIKLQVRRSVGATSRYVSTDSVDVIVVPIQTSDGSIIFNSTYAELDDTGEDTYSTDWVDVDGLSTTVQSDVDGNMYAFATFNCELGGGDTTASTGEWRLVMDGVPLESPAISRYIGTSSDIGIVGIMGITNTVQGSHTMMVQHRVESAGDTITTRTGGLGFVAMTDDEGAEYGVQVPLTQVTPVAAGAITNTSPQKITNTANTETLPDIGKMWNGVVWNTNSGGLAETASFDIENDFISVSSTYSRYTTSADDGACIMFGLSDTKAKDSEVDGHINGWTDGNPIYTSNWTYLMAGGCVEPIPSPTPTP